MYGCSVLCIYCNIVNKRVVSLIIGYRAGLCQVVGRNVGRLGRFSINGCKKDKNYNLCC